MKQVNVAIGIVFLAGKILICRRPADKDDAFAGLWEFPGGKFHEGESPEECLKRELLEEVGICIRPATALPLIDYQYPAIHVRLHPYLCEFISGEAQGMEGQEIRWIAPAELHLYEFPAANKGLIQALVERGENLWRNFP